MEIYNQIKYLVNVNNHNFEVFANETNVLNLFIPSTLFADLEVNNNLQSNTSLAKTIIKFDKNGNIISKINNDNENVIGRWVEQNVDSLDLSKYYYIVVNSIIPVTSEIVNVTPMYNNQNFSLDYLYDIEFITEINDINNVLINGIDFENFWQIRFIRKDNNMVQSIINVYSKIKYSLS